MACSSGSLETSGNSHSTFSFKTQFMDSSSSSSSFTDLLTSNTYDFNDGFKSISPSSYFAFPPGLSPADLLDSPVLLSSSHALPSPTTGALPFQEFNWMLSNSDNHHHHHHQDVKQGKRNYSDFSFQSQTKPSPILISTLAAENTVDVKYKTSDASNIQTNTEGNREFHSDGNQSSQPSQYLIDQKRSDDGYNWRKYGQKQVKGSENPRSYYKCSYPNCPIKKKVERSLDGQITEIVYKGSHNHPKPQSTRKSSSASLQSFQNSSITQISEVSTSRIDSVSTPDTSSISMGDDEFDHSTSQMTKSGGEDLEQNDEPEAKRWKKEIENEGVSSTYGSKTLREPRVVVQTRSDIDILDDGYRWRKYGQKVVKGNPNPRSYYKCTSAGCPVRKHVERASLDLRSVITSYEGKHNHDVPAARGSGSNAVIRPSPDHNIKNLPNSILTISGGKTPFKIDQMLQSSGFSGGYGNSMGSYMNQPQYRDSAFLRTKEEPKGEVFLESLLC